jgi:hypothetical protein
MTTQPMRILASRIELIRDGNQICALIGRDLQAGAGGFGGTVPEALRDLARNLEQWQVTVEVED